MHGKIIENSVVVFSHCVLLIEETAFSVRESSHSAKCRRLKTAVMDQYHQIISTNTVYCHLLDDQWKASNRRRFCLHSGVCGGSDVISISHLRNDETCPVNSNCSKH